MRGLCARMLTNARIGLAASWRRALVAAVASLQPRHRLSTARHRRRCNRAAPPRHHPSPARFAYRYLLASHARVPSLAPLIADRRRRPPVAHLTCPSSWRHDEQQQKLARGGSQPRWKIRQGQSTNRKKWGWTSAAMRVQVQMGACSIALQARSPPSDRCPTACFCLFALCFCCQFDEKLGNGAYKDVYLAYDTETGKEVAWSAAGGESRENHGTSVHAQHQHATTCSFISLCCHRFSSRQEHREPVPPSPRRAEAHPHGDRDSRRAQPRPHHQFLPRVGEQREGSVLGETQPLREDGDEEE